MLCTVWVVFHTKAERSTSNRSCLPCWEAGGVWPFACSSSSRWMLLMQSSSSKKCSVCISSNLIQLWHLTLLASQSSMSICYSFQLIFLHWTMCLDPIQHLLLKSGYVWICFHQSAFSLCPTDAPSTVCKTSLTVFSWNFWGFSDSFKMAMLDQQQVLQLQVKIKWLAADCFRKGAQYLRRTNVTVGCCLVTFCHSFSKVIPRCNAPNCHHLLSPL